MSGPEEALATRDELLRFEIALASREASGLAGTLTDLIADDFVEFGASGRAWTAASAGELLAIQAGTRPSIEDFEIHFLSVDVVLATYRISAPVPSNRSSVWVRRDGAWLIRFHQGTNTRPERRADRPPS